MALMRRAMMAQAARGTLPLVLGDVAGDMTRLVADMDGQVIRIGGPDGERVNPLDVGDWAAAVGRLPPSGAAAVRATVIEHRVSIVTTLLGLVRGAAVTSEEAAVLAAVIAHVTETERAAGAPAEIADLEHLVRQPTGRVRSVVAWLEYPLDLVHSLQQLLDGDLGDVDGPTTTALRIDCAPAIAIDIASAPAGQQRAAALAIALAHGLAAAETATQLAWATGAPHRPVLAIHPSLTPTDHIPSATGFGPGRRHREPLTTAPRG